MCRKDSKDSIDTVTSLRILSDPVKVPGKPQDEIQDIILSSTLERNQLNEWKMIGGILRSIWKITGGGEQEE